MELKDRMMVMLSKDRLFIKLKDDLGVKTLTEDAINIRVVICDDDIYLSWISQLNGESEYFDTPISESLLPALKKMGIPIVFSEDPEGNGSLDYVQITQVVDNVS